MQRVWISHKYSINFLAFNFFKDSWVRFILKVLEWLTAIFILQFGSVLVRWWLSAALKLETLVLILADLN